LSDAVSRLFSAEAGKWEARYQRKYFQDRLDVLDRWLSVSADRPLHRALDVGCGTFPMAPVFRRHNLPAVGIDIAKDMVAVARDLGRDAIHYSGGNIPFDDKAFDAVILFNVLEFVEDPGRLFSEIGRISRPGAKFLLTFSNFRGPFRLVLSNVKKLAANRRRSDPDYIVGRYGFSTVEKMLNHAGFIDARVFRHSLPWAYERLFSHIPIFVIDLVFRNYLFSDVIYVEAKRSAA